jgi:hypothetical protein
MHAFGLAAAGMTLAAAIATAPPAMGETIIGTRGDDRLRGTAGADTIIGLSGSDLIMGLTGTDVMFGFAGNDVIRGGPGIDWFAGHRGHDRIWGGTGPDAVIGGGGNDQIRGGPGGTVAVLGTGGTPGLDGGPGNDRIWGGAGADRLSGDAGDDWLFPGPRADITAAGGGRDQVLLRTDDAPDQIGCGLGADIVWYTGPADPADTLTGCEQVHTHATPSCVTRGEWDRAVVGTPKEVAHQIFETPGRFSAQFGPTEFRRAYQQCRPDPGYDECWADVDYLVGDDGIARIDEKAWSSLCAGS